MKRRPSVTAGGGAAENEGGGREGSAAAALAAARAAAWAEKLPTMSEESTIMDERQVDKKMKRHTQQTCYKAHMPSRAHPLFCMLEPYQDV
jgi:hypothetical protein